MSAYTVVCKEGDKDEECVTIPLTPERAVQAVKDMTALRGEQQKTAFVLMGTGVGLVGRTGEVTFYIKLAVGEDDKTLTVAVAKRLRVERGLRLPTHKPYENVRLARIATLQNQLFAQLDELDKELQSL